MSPTAEPPQTAPRALGRYELLRPLARGGMAEVFVARRRGAGGIAKRLVIKMIRSERARDPRLTALFVREARISMALSHQNVVPVFDFGRAGDALFLAMEWVEGCDLGAALAAGGTLPPGLAAFVGAQCCAALAHAHGKRLDDATVGVVHRDVTPRNLLLSWDGEVRLADFGVAALRDDGVGAVRGTPRYMAPEQARGEEVDGRADLYALGLVLREAVTGLPARPADPREALAVARAGTLPPLELDGPLRTIVERATAAAPADRYPDARRMRDDLERAATDALAGGGAASHALADWLARHVARAVEAPATDEGRALDVITFLDDGEAAVLGTGTARSLAETADDAAPPAPDDAAPPARDDAAPAPAVPGAGGVHRRRRYAAGLLAAGLLAASLAAAVLATRRAPERRARPGSVEAPPAAAPSSRTPPPTPTPTAATLSPSLAAATPTPTPTPDATPPAPTPVRTASASAPPRPRRARPGAPRRAADQAPPTPSEPTTAARRRVTIGARPWARFFVGDDPTPHETPETLELPPGRHRVRFVNPVVPLERTIELVVPPDHDVRHVEVLAEMPP